MSRKNPARRHDGLIPFSRDHHHGLVRAAALRKAEKGSQEERLAALGDWIAEWEARMRRHFQDEERLLAPLMEPRELQRLVADHEALRDAIAEATRQIALRRVADGSCGWAGERLEGHIRWEERELFENLERRATTAQLEDLAAATGRRDAPPPSSETPSSPPFAPPPDATISGSGIGGATGGAREGEPS